LPYVRLFAILLDRHAAGYARLLDGRLLSSRQAVFDIVCNRETELLKDARAAGAVAVDGVMMLVHQGAKAMDALG
jgi:shikimate dehydrogenase